MPCCRRSFTYATRWAFYFLLLVALVLSCVSVSSCRFVDVRNPSALNSVYKTTGLFRHLNMETNTCDVIYESFNSAEHSARMGGVTAPIAGFLAVILMALESACSGGCCRQFGRYLAQFILLVAMVAQGLTFLWIGSADCGGDWRAEVAAGKETQCTTHVAEGAACSVTALLIYFICFILICFVPAPYEKKPKGGDEETRDGQKAAVSSSNEIV